VAYFFGGHPVHCSRRRCSEKERKNVAAKFPQNRRIQIDSLGRLVSIVFFSADDFEGGGWGRAVAPLPPPYCPQNFCQ